MKNLKSISAILLFSLTVSFSANASKKDSTKVTWELRSEIIKYLRDKIPLDLKSPQQPKLHLWLTTKMS